MFVYVKVNQFSTYMLGTVYHSLIFYTQTSIYTFLFNLGIIMPQTLPLTLHILKHFFYITTGDYYAPHLYMKLIQNLT